MMELNELAKDVMLKLKRAGADKGDVYVERHSSVSVQSRAGDVEVISNREGWGGGIRVYKEGRLAFASASDLSPAAMDDLISRVISLVKEADPDPNYIFVPPQNPEFDGSLDQEDPEYDSVGVKEITSNSLALEKSALSVPKVVRSHGCEFSKSRRETYYLNSEGTSFGCRVTNYSSTATAIADANGGMETAYSFSSNVRKSHLLSSEEVGKEAGERAARLIGSKPRKSVVAPVVFDRFQGWLLLYPIQSAVNGENVRLESSFLAGKLSQQIARETVAFVDDPHLSRSALSSIYDSEGVPTRRKLIVEKGILKSYLYDTYTARKTNTDSTGNARRGDYSSTPSIGCFNFYLEPGDISAEEIIKGIPDGLFLMESMGQGIDPVTGEFSIGGQGIWIEKGELTYPVSKVTISSKLDKMLMNISKIGNDLDFNRPFYAPTLVIDEMTVAGQ